MALFVDHSVPVTLGFVSIFLVSYCLEARALVHLCTMYCGWSRNWS